MNKKALSRAGLVAAAFSAAVLGSAAFASCSGTDVVGKVAASSFKALADASAGRVAWSAPDASWKLSSPAGDEFYLSADFARNNGGSAPDMDKPDAEFSFDAAPFLAAGLDPAKLASADMGVMYELGGGRLMLHFELGADKASPDAAGSLEADFAALLKTHRDRIGYHEKLDHYGVKLGDGNMLEWAKDLSKNDKDLVFVLNPAPLVAAGVDPAKLSGGWAFSKVETKDDAGKTIFVDKFLKPFDLR